MQLLNRTPFRSVMFMDLDHHGAQVLALAVKATYDFGGVDEAKPAAVQRDFEFADVFCGTPGSSSLLYESDANWGRRGTDVAFAGYCHPARPGDREAEVLLRVGSLRKVARVFGDRQWTTTLGIAHMTGPARFDRMPLIYERAFGGVDGTQAESRNPAGRGFRARRSGTSPNQFMAPNIEDPEQLISSIDDHPAPVGFGFVAKAWQPRQSFAGTYDAAWQADRMPLLPLDFDPAFHRAASDGLFSESCLQGGEAIELRGLTPRRQEHFALPRVTVLASFGIDATITPIAMKLDCVLIDAVRRQLVLVWHGACPVEGLVDEIEWVRTEATLH